MHDSIEERETYLYSTERMELRFRHFEALTLPSIQAQQDEDFTFLIMVGENMPRLFLERLHDLIAPVPQIKVIPAPPMKHRIAAQAVILNELGETRPETIQFRLDDDDAVGVDFVRLIRRRAHQTARMRKHWRNMVFEFRKGFYVKLSSEGIHAKTVKTNFLACGLAATFRPEDENTIMNFGHHKLHDTMPTLIEPSPAMYLRAFHDDNDSKDRVKNDQLLPLTQETQLLFKDRFNVDEEQVKLLFKQPA